MLLIPKLYLRNQKVVAPAEHRLTTITEDPQQLASEWAASGVELIHVVDLDVPISGHLPNANFILQCQQALKLRVHVSGNFKTTESIQRYAAAGVENIVLGSIAYQKPEFLKEAIQKAPGKIAVAIDVKNNKVVITGWAVASHKTALDYYEQFAKAGVSACYYSDCVETNGTSQINLAGVRTVAEQAKIPVYYNGEILTMDDMAALLLVEKFGVQGCVLNKALYEQRLDLASSVTYLKERSQDNLAEPTIMEE